MSDVELKTKIVFIDPLRISNVINTSSFFNFIKFQNLSRSNKEILSELLKFTFTVVTLKNKI